MAGAASSGAAAQNRGGTSEKPSATETEKGVYFGGCTGCSQRHLADKSSQALVVVMELQQLSVKAVSSRTKRCDYKDPAWWVHTCLGGQSTRQLSAQSYVCKLCVVCFLNKVASIIKTLSLFHGCFFSCSKWFTWFKSSLGCPVLCIAE